jgi:hypothetical protein
MENIFGDGFLIFGIILFYFSIMILWSKSLSKRISKITRENKNDEENAVVVVFLQLQVILFLILGGFLFMKHRNE